MFPIYGQQPYGWGVYSGGTAVRPDGADDYAVSDDEDYLEGLIHTVSVEHNDNAHKTAQYGLEVVDEDWKPVAGLQNLACRLVIRRPKNEEIGDRPSARLEWKVFFGRSLILDRHNRLVYYDPELAKMKTLPGQTSRRYAYVNGHVVNAHHMNHHWYVMAYENPI